MKRFGWFGLIYLAFLPLNLFSGEPWWFLSIAFVLGLQLFALYERPTFWKTVVFFLVLILSLVFLDPRPGLDLGLLNSVNSQRGEHPNYQTSLVAKLIHNKTELYHSFITNMDKIISPVAVFASGFWHQIDPYYPLGFLYPWDIYLIYRFLRYGGRISVRKEIAYFPLAIISLILLVGLIYLDEALLYGYAIVYFLALLSLLGYQTCARSTKWAFLIVNTTFILYQLSVVRLFRI